MFFVVVLLIAIAWLLWTIHQDLSEANNRQHTLKMELTRLVNRIEQQLDTASTPPPRPARATAGNDTPVEKVALNSASKTRLRGLPKVGAVVAERIIERRPFEQIEQLREIEGITESVYEALKNHVTLN